MLCKIMFKAQSLEPRFRNPAGLPTETLFVRAYISV
jgi:hypothetical protein